MKLDCGVHVEQHGGNCCGIFHMFNFDVELHREIKNFFLPDWYEHLDPVEYYNGMLVEVVLNEYQRPYFEEVLKDAGFVLRNSFTNPNTDNVCYVYHFSED